MAAKFAALLPMKGHSERVKDKNIRDFNGRPLFWHILNTLMQCDYISGVHIDTDSRAIADMARGFFPDVHIIERPKELCGDMVSMNAVIKHDIEIVGGEYFIQTHTTNPLVRPESLQEGCRRFLEKRDKFDSLFSVNRIQTRLYDAAGKAVNHDPGKLIRTQDLPPLYEENSNFYIFSRTSFLKNDTRIGMCPQMMELARFEASDIDEESDFMLAEQIQNLSRKGLVL